MPKLIAVNVTLDAIEVATISAALILWRDTKNRPEELEYLAVQFGEFRPLEPNQIDQVIDKINATDLV